MALCSNSEENQVARAKKRYPEKKSGVAKRSRVERPAPFKSIKRHSAVPEVVEPLITKLSLRKISFPDERRSSVDSQSPSALGSTTESGSSRRSESPATPAEEGQPGPIKIMDTTRDRPVPSSHYTHFAFSFETAPPANSFQSSLPQQAAPYPTPMSHLDSPSYFPLYYFEQVHAPIAPTPAPRWSSLPTPEAEPMSPILSSFPFELQAPLGLFMPPSPAMYTPATPLLHELARNEERRKMEHWLASVEGTGQDHSARDESLAMFGSPIPPNDGLFGYGHSSALGGIHGLF